MLIPYSTDAPIYYFPFATIGLIVLNTVILVATMAAISASGGTESVEWAILQFDRVNPVQWLTNNFMHAGPVHLVGNMFFLWGFGLIGPLMAHLLKQCPDRSAPLRLKLAQILVQVEQRPRQALAVLKKLPSNLPQALQTRRQQITALAKRSIDEGAVELDIYDS